MEITKGRQISEGKAKRLYETNHPQGWIVQYFKDDASAFNGVKLGTIGDKGIINNDVSSWVFRYLEEKGVKTHYREQLSEREMLVEKVSILPVEVVVRNSAAGSLCKRLGIEKGLPLNPPLVEYFLKDDALGDPPIAEAHIFYFKWATPTQLQAMKEQALEVNEILSEVFSGIGLSLIDFKLEFGVTESGQLLLADEFTPDGCRLWDKETGESMDKDRFRHDMGNVEESYQEVHARLKKYFKELQ